MLKNVIIRNVLDIFNLTQFETNIFGMGEFSLMVVLVVR